jgi:hypothetical protein
MPRKGAFCAKLVRIWSNESVVMRYRLYSHKEKKFTSSFENNELS